MADDQQQDAAFWIKETQRRSISVEKAKQDGAPADEIDQLQAALDEADRARQAAGSQ